MEVGYKILKMKRTFLYFVTAALIGCLAGCEEKEPVGGNDNGDTGGIVVPPVEDEDPPVVETLRERLCGEWYYHADEDGVADIYLCLTSEGNFELYQKFDAGVHHLYRGTWTLEEDNLKGEYNDKTAWKSQYSVSVSDDKNTLVLNDGTTEFSYSRTVIPDSVKETCIVEVKSLTALHPLCAY